MTQSRASAVLDFLAHRPRWTRSLLALMVLAFLSRLLRAQALLIIDRDGVRYLDQAAALLRGSWAEGLGGYYPPLYPIGIAILGIVLPLELAAITLNALASALICWLIAAILRPCVGPRAALWAAFAWILLPSALHIGSRVLAETLVLSMALLALAMRSPPQAPYARLFSYAWLRGAVIGLATLGRPEALALLGLLLWPTMQGRPWLSWKELTALLVSILAAVLAILPYALLLHKETGAWSFSRKAGVVAGALAPELSQVAPEALDQTMRAELEARRSGQEIPPGRGAFFLALLRSPKTLASKATRDLVPLIHEGIKLITWPFFFLAMVGLFSARRLGPEKRNGLRALAAPALWMSLAVLFLARPKERYLLSCLPIACALIGLAIRRIEATGSPQKTRLFLASMIILGLLIGARVEGRSKLFLRQIGEQLRKASQPGELVLAPDGRVPYYASRPWRELPNLDRPETLRALIQKLKPRWLVLPRKSIEARWKQPLRVEDWGRRLGQAQEQRRGSNEEWLILALSQD